MAMVAVTMGITMEIPMVILMVGVTMEVATTIHLTETQLLGGNFSMITAKCQAILFRSATRCMDITWA